MDLRGWWREHSPFATAVVAGDSMLPGFRDGDWILIRRTTRVRPGQVVAVPDPRLPDRLLIKRIVRPAPGGWLIAGDNPQSSTDSRTPRPAMALTTPRAVSGSSIRALSVISIMRASGGRP